jgi:hypothetical protein
MQEDKLSMIYDTIIPDSDQYAQLKTMQVSSTYEKDLVYLLDYDKIEAIQKQRVETFEKLDKIHFITGNEKREQVNFEKSDNPSMDEILVSGTLIPIDDVGTPLPADTGGVDEL